MYLDVFVYRYVTRELRASLVCKRWRGILSDPRFRRRFREHHRTPPLLGFFVKDPGTAPFFAPLLDPPDRIPVALPENVIGETPSPWDSFFFAGCRHGVALVLDRRRSEAVLWDPLTAVQRRVRLPPGLGFDYNFRDAVVRSAAVLCAAADDHHGDPHSAPFKLAMACRDGDELKESLVCLYDSSTGVWGDVISIATAMPISMKSAGVLVGNTICWLLLGGDILEFHLERQTLAVIDKPADLHIADPDPRDVGWCFQILRAEDGGLGLAVFSDPKQSIQLWARKSDCDGVVSWVLQKTVQLDERFSRPGCMDDEVLISGYDEDTNAIFLSSVSHDFMLQLESMQFTYLRREEYRHHRIYHPYTSFYTAGRGIAGGDGGAEIVNA